MTPWLGVTSAEEADTEKLTLPGSGWPQNQRPAGRSSR